MKCDHCGGEDGYFNMKTGNHVMCEEIATLRAKLDEAVALLKKMQDNEDYCICCKRYGGHFETCELAAFLAKAFPE